MADAPKCCDPKVLTYLSIKEDNKTKL
uniref:Uncharacterized protein n=1 Tax=Heterorhabditis bacteriophora TaxID=37862 RepID=A0A1I7WFF7_HETBA